MKCDLTCAIKRHFKPVGSDYQIHAPKDNEILQNTARVNDMTQFDFFTS